MARPRKVGLDYFPHDVDLSSDDKIGALEGRFGLLGYAFYLKTLERIYRQGESIKYPGVFRPIMSSKLQISEEKLSDMVRFCVDIELLYLDSGGNLASRGADRRLNFIEHTREFDRNRVIRRKTTGEGHKGNKTKENKIKENEPPEVSTDSVLGRLTGKFQSPMPEADFGEETQEYTKEESEGPEQYPEIKRKGTKETVLEPQAPLDRVEERKTDLNHLKAVFEIARKTYPGTKIGHDPAWKHFIKKHGRDASKIIPQLLPAIESEIGHKKALTDSGLFCPQWKSWERWINGSHWTQDLEKIQSVLNLNGKQSTFETPSNLKERE